MFNKIDNRLPYKSIRAINDKLILNYLNNALKIKKIIKILNNDKILYNFLLNYLKWIKSSKLNKLQNLDKFKHKCFASGTSQIFDYFYAKNKNRRFRAFKGEYAYHYTSWRNHFSKWKYIEKLDINKNDAVVISLPFSDSGSKHQQMEALIKKCDKLKVPVLVDCCYFSMCKGINFNFNHTSIKEIDD